MASKQVPSSDPSLPFSQWRSEYQAALQETDHNLLFKRIEIAEAALLNRREALSHGPDGREDQKEIAKAVEKLRTLKKNILNFPL